MADTSAILAAGNIGGQQQNPLDLLGKVQGIVNAQQYNKLMQQSLINEQTSNQVAQQGLATNRNAAIGQEAYALSFAPDGQQTADNYKAAVDRQLALGRIDANTASVWKAQIPEGATANEYRLLAAQHAFALMNPQVQQTMAQPATGWLNTGGEQQPYKINPIGTPNPGQVTNTPIYTGGAVPNTLTPGDQANQVGRPATQQDVQEFAQHGITIQPGTIITEPMKQRLIQQGHPELLPGGGGGGGSGAAPPVAPAPGGPAAPVPQRTVPPVSRGGAPVSPQAPPRLGTVTSMPPNTEKEFAVAGDLFAREQAEAADFYNRDANQTKAIEALRTANTGPGTDAVNEVKSFLYAQSPSFLKDYIPGVDIAKIEAHDIAVKQLNSIALSFPGAGGSDLRTHLSELSNPSTKISNAAAINVMNTLQGLSRMRQGAYESFMAQNSTGGKMNPGASVDFGSFASKFGRENDYRAFRPMTQDEFAATVKSLKTPEERAKFKHSYEIAQGLHFQPPQ